MNRIWMILILMCAVRVPAVFSMDDPLAVLVEKEQPKGPVVKTIRGKVEALNFDGKSFQLIPDNVGNSIKVYCDSTMQFSGEEEPCSMEGISKGLQVETRLAYENGKWQARSVKIL